MWKNYGKGVLIVTFKKNIQNQLVDARESLGFDINYVQSITGISTVVLEGFEAGNFDVVEPVFSRLALRTYADFLGLDVEDLLSDLEMIFGEKDKPNIGNFLEAEKSRDAIGSFSFFPLFIVFSILSAIVFFFVAFSNTGQQSLSSVSVDNTESDIVNQIGINKPPLEIVNVEDDRSFPIKAADSYLFATSKLHKEDPISSAVVKMTEKERIESVNSFGSQTEDSERSGLVSKVSLKSDSTRTSSEIYVDMGINSKPQNVERPNLSVNTTTGGIEAVPRNRSYSDTLSLVLIAVDTTWVRVEWGDAKFFESLMLPEQQKRFSSTDSFFVHAGKPHGIIYYFNGGLLTRTEIGESNRVLRFRADNNGITTIDSKLKPLRTFVKP